MQSLLYCALLALLVGCVLADGAALARRANDDDDENEQKKPSVFNSFSSTNVLYFGKYNGDSDGVFGDDDGQFGYNNARVNQLIISTTDGR